MNAVQRYNERMLHRMREASESEVLMREEAARLKQERSISDTMLAVYEAEQQELREVAA